MVKKEAPESTAEVHFEPATNTDIAEKVPIPQCADEKPQLPASVDMKQSDSEPLVDVKKESTVDFEMEESSIVLIQSAVRGLLVFSILYRRFDVSNILTELHIAN